jgi:orotate phosphoribosyltransferase
MQEMLRTLDARQIVGAGYGSFLLVGSLLATSEDLRGGVIRHARKTYGFRERVEGALQSHRPVVLVDDVIASGSSALEAAEVLWREGFFVSSVCTIFEYSWCSGRQNLLSHNLSLHSLGILRNRGCSLAPKVNT